MVTEAGGFVNSIARRLWYPEQLVRLQAKPPPRIGKTVFHGLLSIGLYAGPAHGLEKEIFEIQMLEPFRLGAFLWKDKLQLIAGPDDKFSAGLGAHGDPVYASRQR